MTVNTPQPVAEAPKPITIEDVHKMLGGMMLEIEMLRRENVILKEQLAKIQE